LSYEQGLGTVASNLVKIDYSLSRRWSLRAETGTSSGGGLFYRFSWD
jgi:autotransporter translocation and assembly factor TamB